MVFKQNIAHNLPQQEALSRIRKTFTRLRLEQKGNISGIKEDWQNETGTFQFTALGFTVSGALTVHPSIVEINAKVPFAVFLFRSKIKQIINEHAKELLAE